MEEITRVDIRPATWEKIRVKQEQEDASSNQTPLGFNLRWPPLPSAVPVG